MRPSEWLLHLSLAVIVVGACVTWLFADRGQIVLGAGESTDSFVTSDGRLLSLPAAVRLDSFVIDMYPGMAAPRDFVSHVTLAGESRRVTVNDVVEFDGYRFHQAAYRQGNVSVIGVSHDPWGMTLVYAGFILFAVAGLWMLVDPRGRFRLMLKSLMMLAALWFPLSSFSAVPGVSEDNARSQSTRQVLYNGRVAPLSTVAHDFAGKVTGSHHPGGTSPERLMLSLMLYPGDWTEVPFIKIGNERLARELGVDGTHVSLNQLADSAGNYRLRSLMGRDATLDNAILSLDERVELVVRLQAGQLFSAVPTGVRRLSPFEVGAEQFYTRFPLSLIYMITSFVAAAVVLATVRRGRLFPAVATGIAMTVGIVLYALRWLISGTVPMTDGSEAMLTMSLLLVAGAFIACLRRARVVASAAVTAGVFAALVAHLGLREPAMTPLMPVLRSPWLSIHVLLVMMSYSILFVTAIISLVALMLPRTRRRLARVSLVLLYPAEILLGLGIATGSVWANIAWGRYWAWDPKETWALITFLVYAVPFHRRLLPLSRPVRFHVYILVAILTVVMTYWGVNYLPSLHSYS